MIISINQPAYLPWLGYFDRIAKSDLHVILDDVQFERGSFVNRNKICVSGSPNWLTVPLQKKGQFGKTIREIEINNDLMWSKKHWESMRHAYSSSKYYKEFSEKLYEIYNKKWHHLVSLIGDTTEVLLEELNIGTPWVYSSTLNIRTTKSDRILDICKAVHANKYLSGEFGTDYLDEDKFYDSGIQIEYQSFVHPTYRQNSDVFVPNLSVIDLIFNEGAKARAFLI